VNAAVRADVVRVLVEVLGVSEAELTDDADLERDLGADSLDQVELVLVLEEYLQQDVADEAILGLRTVRDIVRYIESAQRREPYPAD
jgi:acyl carrier protein